MTGLNCPPSFGDEYNYDEYLQNHKEVEPKFYNHHHQQTTPLYDDHRGEHVVCDEYGNCGKTFNFPHDHDEHYPIHHGSTHHHHTAHYPHVNEHEYDYHHSDHDVHIPFFPYSHNSHNKPSNTVPSRTQKPSLGCGVLPAANTRNIGVYPWIVRLAYLNTSKYSI